MTRKEKKRRKLARRWMRNDLQMNRVISITEYERRRKRGEIY